MPVLSQVNCKFIIARKFKLCIKLIKVVLFPVARYTSSKCHKNLRIKSRSHEMEYEMK